MQLALQRPVLRGAKRLVPARQSSRCMLCRETQRAALISQVSPMGSLKGPRFLDLSEARSRLYQSRSLQVNSHFSHSFEIYKIILRSFQISWIFPRLLHHFCKIQHNFANFHRLKHKFAKFHQNFHEIFSEFHQISGNLVRVLLRLQKSREI